MSCHLARPARVRRTRGAAPGEGFRRFAGRALVAGALAWAGAASALEATRAPYGMTRTGAAVEVFTLTNDRGMRVRVLSYGGVIDEIRAPDRHGRFANVVVGLPDLRAYEADGTFNAIVGRYANRIAGGGFTLDGVTYRLPSGANGIASHGGRTGLGSRLWSGRPFQDRGRAGVELSYRSPDGESGFPGVLDVRVTYTLDNRNELRVAYQARTDKPTVVNLTSHAYFNLSGDAARDILDHRLMVAADSYTPTDALQAPTGEIAPVEGTPFDLRTPVRIGDRLGSPHPQMAFTRGGFDHNLMLRRRVPGRATLAARLEDPQTGRGLEVRTTEPAVQVYTANYFNGSMTAAGGQKLLKHYGLALETEHVPDSPNKPQFPSTVLRPGEVFRSETAFRFYVRKAVR